MTKKTDEKRYEVITQEDENGDLLIPIPPQVLQQLGWKEGDELQISQEDNGTIIFSKV